MRISDWSSDVCSSDLFQLSCRQATIRKRRRAATMAEVTIKGRDGSFKAYLALPRTTPAAGVVVAQEIFGVNQVMRDTCDWLAGAGFVAICPDLFWRIEPGIDLTDKTQAEWDRPFELFGLFDVDKGIADMKEALATLRAHQACTGKAGPVGYCLGRKFALPLAKRPDPASTAGYHGLSPRHRLGEAGRRDN